MNKGLAFRIWGLEFRALLGLGFPRFLESPKP